MQLGNYHTQENYARIVGSGQRAMKLPKMILVDVLLKSELYSIITCWMSQMNALTLWKIKSSALLIIKKNSPCTPLRSAPTTIKYYGGFSA